MACTQLHDKYVDIIKHGDRVYKSPRKCTLSLGLSQVYTSLLRRLIGVVRWSTYLPNTQLLGKQPKEQTPTSSSLINGMM